MSILSKASFVQIPSGYGEDKLYSEVPNTAAGDFQFTRASTGTRVNSDGYIEEVPWNYNTNSEDLNSNTKLNVVVTSNDIISPDGTQNADKLETTFNNSYKLLKTNSISFVNGTDYAFSFYAKKGTTDFIQLITTNTLFGATSEWANFDLNNGVVSSDNYGGASIEDYGNGWYRCQMISSCVSSGTDGWYVSIITSGTSTRAEATTSVVNVYVWGLQVVKGTSPKTYIKTTDRLNVPRLDYSGGASCPTLLLEPQRTNKSNNSEDWTATGYVKNNCTAIANQTTSPENNQTADQLDFGSGSGFFYENVTTITAASTYSVFVKYIDYQYIQIIGTGDVDHYANFDIQNGIVGNTGSQSTASIEDYGNGWYRCIINYNSGTFAGGARLYKTTSLTAGWASGGGVAGSFYFWGNQMEVGTFATSYIPTSGTSVTRVGDVCEDAGDATIFNDSEGVIFAEIASLSNVGVVNRGISISDGTNTNQIVLRFAVTANQITAYIADGGVITAQLTHTLTNALSYNKLALKYKVNDVALWVNGTEVATDTNATMPSGFDELKFSRGDGINKFYGKCKELIYFNEALTDTELQELTTI